ncbi:MAG: hypothetical protein RQ966_17880 [Acetobacteraceae bacterium]|nr:hypothetical protein [Acetobacteraceae bacterium]
MVDGILVLVVLESVLLAVLGRARILPNLLAGFMLLVAMRLALADGALAWVGLSLLGAGLAHLVDLRWRWG